MKLAITGDTHMPRGSRRLPDRAVELLRDADAILHTGDFHRLETLRWFEALGPPVHAVQGNVDDAELRELLPLTRVDRFGEARIAMTHVPGPSAGRVVRLRHLFPDVDAVVFGHTHMPEHAGREGFQIFNPGSPTERRRAPTKTIGLAHVEGPRIVFELVHLD